METLKQNRDPWLFEKANEIVGFYTREFYCLDNFSAFKITYKGHKYSTVEEVNCPKLCRQHKKAT